MRRVLFICLLNFACSDAPPSTSHGTASLDVLVSPDATNGLGETGEISRNHKDVVQDQQTKELPMRPGSFGTPCKANNNCDSGFCVDTRAGKVCSVTCVSDCPSGFECTSTTGSDLIYVCVSLFVRLCDPCKEHSDCNSPGTAGNVCVSHASAGSFCGVACNPAHNDCPQDSTCQQITDVKTGISSTQCMPSSGLCTCSARAILLGLSTPCINKNFYGSCKGQRTCTSQGLSNCVGQIPDVETCNNIDDNCDGEIDNVGSSFLGSVCKQTNQFGVCTGAVTGCAKGEPVCNAPEPAPESCDGKDNDCNGNTDEGLCEDGNECTTDTCNTDGSCKHAKLTGTPCDDGNVCTTVEQCAAGVCVGGNTLDCNDNDQCSLDSCDPFTGCKHVPASEGACPDDGNACTQDVCKNGACTHPNVKDGTACATDGEVCTTDICKSGECQHLANTVACNDGNPCTLNDTCKDKTCSVSVPKVCSDNNPCTLDECDPKIGCVFKPNPSWKDGLPCPDDGNPCTDDICKGSTCSHVPIPNCG